MPSARSSMFPCISDVRQSCSGWSCGKWCWVHLRHLLLCCIGRLFLPLTLRISMCCHHSVCQFLRFLYKLIWLIDCSCSLLWRGGFHDFLIFTSALRNCQSGVFYLTTWGSKYIEYIWRFYRRNYFGYIIKSYFPMNFRKQCNFCDLLVYSMDNKFLC